MYHVLYVDDEPSVLKLGKQFLEQSGDFTVTTAASAPEAIGLLEQQKFDAIISDYQMPGTDGIQFLVEVRTRFGTIPFILFTGRGREDVVVKAFNSGADFYLTKSDEPEGLFNELVQKIKLATSRKMAVDPLAQLERLKDVIVVIPAYNEELVIGSIVLKACRIVEKVIVVDDGSSDHTADMARYAGAEVIQLPENMEKAHAIKVGLNRARVLGCTAAVMLDGDGQHKTTEIPIVVKPVLDGTADLVIGSRFLSKAKDVPAYRRVGQKTLDLFTMISSNYACTDSQSGFRALSKKALENLDFTSYGYGIESDMISHFAERGLVIVEVPITVRYDVPQSHKKNFISHGLVVLSGIINLISYKHPLPAFGIPGLVLFVSGVVVSSYTFAEYYTTSRFPFALSMLSIALLILGLLLIIAGLILNALVVIMAKNRMAESGVKK